MEGNILASIDIQNLAGYLLSLLDHLVSGSVVHWKVFPPYHIGQKCYFHQQGFISGSLGFILVMRSYYQIVVAICKIAFCS